MTSPERAPDLNKSREAARVRDTVTAANGYPPGARAGVGMGKARLRPLPRSLDPLPGEALNGFLLRTAYRLERSPARIAQLTDLFTTGSSRGIVPFALLMDLAPEQRAPFAAATRLTEAEAAAMCLSGFAERYPAAMRASDARAVSQTRKRSARMYFSRAQRWLSGPVRWCPKCLAGDGTPAQDQLGGAWSKTWWLPVVFACTRHQRLLEHRCPGCSRPLAEQRTSAAAILNATLSGMHPARCRLLAPGYKARNGSVAVACGAPLTAAPPTAAFAGPALGLQHRILALLDPGQPAAVTSAGHPATAAQYFTDLRLIAELIRASWPRVTSLTDVPATLAELADHDSRHVADGKIPQRRIYDDPPPDAAASCALLTVADQLLAHDPRDLGQHILHMLAHDPRRAAKVPWSRGWP